MRHEKACPPIGTILDDLRARLVCGDYSGLAELAQDLEQVVTKASETELRAAVAGARQTAACLASAQAGVLSAKRRLSGVTEAHGTYDQNGTRALLAGTAAALRRI